MTVLPTYLKGEDAAALEAAYLARDVVYLLGTGDNDPNHPFLDKTCMAEAEGPIVTPEASPISVTSNGGAHPASRIACCLCRTSATIATACSILPAVLPRSTTCPAATEAER